MHLLALIPPPSTNKTKQTNEQWSNETIQTLVESSFVFWQRSTSSSAGQNFLRLYSNSEEEMPQIIIIGPTGAKILMHTGFIQAWAGMASFVITVLAPELGACDCSLEFAPDDDAATYILEVFYEENTPSPAGHAGYYWELDQQEPELM